MTITSDTSQSIRLIRDIQGEFGGSNPARLFEYYRVDGLDAADRLPGQVPSTMTTGGGPAWTGGANDIRLEFPNTSITLNNRYAAPSNAETVNTVYNGGSWTYSPTAVEQVADEVVADLITMSHFVNSSGADITFTDAGYISMNVTITSIDSSDSIIDNRGGFWLLTDADFNLLNGAGFSLEQVPTPVTVSDLPFTYDVTTSRGFPPPLLNNITVPNGGRLYIAINENTAHDKPFTFSVNSIQISQTEDSLSESTGGGTTVTQINQNVPTSGPISTADFYGATNGDT